ncbi:polyprenol monophosphomannose synthase [SAR202 cluster bacterium AC-409-J13_OGT_754m]|nr:polyprenol monophosphomannose synthase [SAR202 cluster bacterium AC-409-J13_OGT_754m]
MTQNTYHISIIIPTYNEAQNIEILISELTNTLTHSDYQILIIDDNSPDHTYDIVKAISMKKPNIYPIHRHRKMGLSSAILDGFHKSSGSLIVIMDSDLSHQPSDLLPMLEAAANADIVIGSRYTKGGKIIGWSFVRHIASRTANWLSKTLIVTGVNDTTSGFAIFKRATLESVSPLIKAKGFKFLLEVLAYSPNPKVIEIPITFANRTKGTSKFNIKEILLFLRLCFWLYIRRLKLK